MKMDKLVNFVAGFGVPGVMFVVAVSMTGLSGAAAYVAALVLLGPGGMLGGLATLGVTGLIVAALSNYGIDALLSAIIHKLYKKGETKESIRKKIEKGPWSFRLKAKAISYLDKL